MGLIDEYKSPKNRELLSMASFKMMKDKFKIEITDKNIQGYQIIIKNTISAISNDAILMNTRMKLQELNNITLVKIKEHIDALQQQEQQEQYLQKQKLEEQMQEESGAKHDSPKIQDSTDDIDKKISDEDIQLKVQELEEKRRISNILLQTEGYKMIEDTITDNQYNNINSMNTYFNPNLLTDVIYQITDVKKPPYTKMIVINSHSRDWLKYPNRSLLKFSINIDFTQYSLEPFIILFPEFVKEMTPYVIMCISDGTKVQKFYFILSETSQQCKWDKWILMNRNNTETIFLENKNWNITFYDFMNNELDMGNDDISILEVNHIQNNIFKIKIAKNHQYKMNLSDNCIVSVNVILRTHSDNNEHVQIKLVDKQDNDVDYLEYYLYCNETQLQMQDFMNSKILYLHAQYSIVMMQQKKT
jgi:hypothetical protein